MLQTKALLPQKGKLQERWVMSARVRRFRREDVEAFLERCKGVAAVE
jgi:hypothetical protein